MIMMLLACSCPFRWPPLCSTSAWQPCLAAPRSLRPLVALLTAVDVPLYPLAGEGDAGGEVGRDGDVEEQE